MATTISKLRSQTLEEKPLVLVLADALPSWLENLISCLEGKDLQVFIINLEDLKNKKQLLAKYHQLDGQEIYKIIVSYGFLGREEAEFNLIFDFINAITQLRKTDKLVFFSPYTRSFKSLEGEVAELAEFFDLQTDFLKSALKKFPEASFFLAQDLVTETDLLLYPFKLFIRGITNGTIWNPVLNFYWQSSLHWQRFLQEQILKPQPALRYIFRGQPNSSNLLTEQLQRLLAHYYQLDLEIRQLMVEQLDDGQLLADFTAVTQVDKSFNDFLDEKLRQLPTIKAQLESVARLKPKKSAPSSPLTIEKTAFSPVSEETPLVAKATANLAPKVVLKSKKTENIERAKAKKIPEKKIDESVEIDQKIKEIFKDNRLGEKQVRVKDNLQASRKIIDKSRKRRVLFYAGLVVFSCGAILSSIFISFYLSQARLKQLLTRYLEGDTEVVLSEDRLIYQYFSWQVLKAEQLLGTEQLSASREILDLAKILNQQALAKKLSQASFFNLYQEMMRGDGDLLTSWEELKTNINHYSKLTNELNDYFSNLNFEILADKQFATMEQYRQQTQLELKQLRRLLNVIEPLEELLMSPARTKLLVLVQDNSELRSSGGFLSSLINLSFENGFLVDQQVQNVAEFDDNAYGQREVNSEIKALFGEEKLLLRDSNWSSDFSEVSQDVNWFVQQASGSSADLFLSINIDQLKELLNFFGELNVENSQGQNLTVKGLNLFELLEENWTLDMNKVSGRFIDSLLVSLLDRVKQLNQTELLAVGDLILTKLETKENFIVSSDNSLNQAFELNLWTGRRLDTLCPGEFKANGECFLDGIYQLENNISLNKVNRYLKQEIEHNIGISENFIRHKRLIHYENFARQSSWPEGDYQAFLKFYLPLTAKIERIKIGGELLDASRYQLQTEGDKLILSLKLAVPIRKQVDLELVYLLENNLVAPFSYAFLDQKQAGVFNKETQYNVVFAQEFQPNLIAPNADYQNQIINFKNNNQDHFLFAVAFENSD